MERLHPGVYLEEAPNPVRPIEGVSTSTAAFLGKAETGPLDHARLVTSFIEFQAVFGGFRNDGYLAHAALQFFNNGGTRLYGVRVAKDARAAAVEIGDRKGTPARTLTITAVSAGQRGNDLEVVVSNGTQDPGNEFTLTVRQGGAVVETFADLGLDPDAANFADNVVNARSQLIRVAVDTADDTTAKGTSVSAAGAVTTLTDRRRLQVNVDGDGVQPIVLADPVTTGAQIASAIENAVRQLTPLRGSTPAAAFAQFTATFVNNVYTLTSGAPGRRSSVQVTNAPDGNAATLLRLGVTNGGSETGGAAVLRPANGVFLLGDGTVGGATLGVTAGSDGVTPQDADFLQALKLLDPVRDVNIVAVPGIGSKQVIDGGSGYCGGRGDCFFIGDLPSSVNTRDTARTFVEGLTVKSSHAAVYFPWLSMVNPAGTAPDPLPVPPSGFVAGTYARIDARRGIWKAPAGTEANVAGAVGLTAQLSDADQDVLNPVGVNAVRFFPSSGIVLWGTRTLATVADPAYRYIPVRRLAIFLEQSIANGIQFAVFEPNDENLWASLRLNVGAFMTTLFRAGAFQGDTPSKAFFVKCDPQTNPQEQIDAGIVTLLVGFAPLRPAEFVVIRVSQKTVGN
ncbi:phage tail sheath subtilisin-like domain-containing protein [Nonomuraea endophytica]|uniref:phage tail sheath subtilisin-like domain-containing protein n=1 Tax=Nonomuraea endophytica TaxID=714136 RepID=UPI0037C65F27